MPEKVTEYRVLRFSRGEDVTYFIAEVYRYDAEDEPDDFAPVRYVIDDKGSLHDVEKNIEALREKLSASFDAFDKPVLNYDLNSNKVWSDKEKCRVCNGSGETARYEQVGTGMEWMGITQHNQIKEKCECCKGTGELDTDPKEVS